MRPGFLLRHLAPALLIACLLLVLETTPLDTTVSAWFFDAGAGAFPLRYNSAIEIITHQWAKLLVIVVACCVIAMYALSFVLEDLKPQRRLLLFLALALTLAPLSVALFKAASVRHCPWNLQEFGGFAPHLSLFSAAPPGLPAGRCFPAGHASTGFCLMAFYFVGRAQHRPLHARLGLAGGILAGLTLGAFRIAQGAHFVSHVLWSGVVCWTVIVVLFGLTVERGSRDAAPAPS